VRFQCRTKGFVEENAVPDFSDEILERDGPANRPKRTCGFVVPRLFALPITEHDVIELDKL
jgi:hypothetical protein